MNKSVFVKKIVVTITILTVVTVFLSSCHRGYGCPGQISQQIDIEQTPTPINVVEDC